MQFRIQRSLQSAATASRNPLPCPAHSLLQFGVKQEPPRPVYLKFLLLVDKCHLRVDSSQRLSDTLLLLTAIDAEVALINKQDRKSTRLNSSHRCISYAVFCLKKKKKK